MQLVRFGGKALGRLNLSAFGWRVEVGSEKLREV
jgi:hypothetical protein